MTARRRWPLALPIAIGLLVALGWVAWIGSEALWGVLRRTALVEVPLLLAVTTGWFLLRFLRSQFLLRYAGVRVPIRPALATYLAALPGTATPAYLGETVRSLFLKRRFGSPVRVTLLVLLVERLLDVIAIAILAILCSSARQGVIGWGALAVASLAWLVVDRLVRRTGMAVPSALLLRSLRVALPALVMSLVAWAGAGLLYWLAGRALELSVGPVAGIGVLARSTLWGALTLLPAGFGATGSAAIVDLQATHSLPDAAALVTLVRLASTGFALFVGMIFLVCELRGGATAPEEGVAHFDAIAEAYSAQWSPHVWDLLIGRKIGMLAEALGPPDRAGIGVDLGCGLGLQTEAMRQRGYRVVGVEPAVELLKRRRDPGSPVVAGDALHLPFRDGSIDFVYTIGVLHHLPGRAAQADARREIARVLRPGGLLLVHESNPRNPLFRFYMTYAFPILKQIDEGTEWWISPDTWRSVEAMRLEGTRYFTFLPDFIPRVLMRPALAIERWLERGPTRPYSAHYLAVLRREEPADRG